MSKKKLKFLNLICDKCHKEYIISRKNFNYRILNNVPNLCQDCMKEYKLDKLNNGYRNYIDNETEEEKIIR